MAILFRRYGENMPVEKPVSTGLLTRTEKKEDKPQMNDAVRLLKLVKDKVNGATRQS
jgi:hypothetical protein